MSAVRTAHRIAAVLLLCFAAVPGYYAVTLRWAPRIDFDIIGFLFLLQNLPRLMAWALTFAFLAAAIWCWVRSTRL